MHCKLNGNGECHISFFTQVSIASTCITISHQLRDLGSPTPKENIHRLCGFLPLTPDPDQAAHRSREANEPIVQIQVAQSGAWNREVAEIRY